MCEQLLPCLEYLINASTLYAVNDIWSDLAIKQYPDLTFDVQYILKWNVRAVLCKVFSKNVAPLHEYKTVSNIENLHTFYFLPV